MVFNNGDKRPGGSISSVDEVAPPVDGSGNYSLTAGQAFGPDDLFWTYNIPQEYYANHISSAQRLPDGNTFYCAGTKGYFGEVTSDGTHVWEYQTAGGAEVARAARYRADYPGLSKLSK